jgi:hypothetical protein
MLKKEAHTMELVFIKMQQSLQPLTIQTTNGSAVPRELYSPYWPALLESAIEQWHGTFVSKRIDISYGYA